VTLDDSEPRTSSPQPRAYALLLAAGSASRFGGDKLLAPLHGRPLVSHAALAVAEAIAAGVLAGGVAIVPPAAGALAETLGEAGLRVARNSESHLGRSTSLRLGLAILENLTAPPAGAALIVLADQPGLQSDVITRLVETWRKTGKSARPRYLAAPLEPGHPVLLDRSLWPLARGLRGDAGLLASLGEQALTLIDVAGANPDVDAPADLRRFEDPR
jgi:CTP:molybdopterin cytidylyltransferase MocA